jgi:hypothetical protein
MFSPARLRCLLMALVVTLAAGPAARAAEDSRLTLAYTIYAAGLKVVQIDVRSDLNATGYGLALGFRTAGLYGAFFPGEIVTDVQGLWHDEGAAPLHLASHGIWRGAPYEALIDYLDDRPLVRRLEPPNAKERAPVPEARQAHTIDTLSALAVLVHRVARTGRCDGGATTYDGRRLTEISATTVGMEVLEPTGRSSFAGSALRCDFTGRQLDGFMFDEDPQTAGRPKHGSAWLAPVAPGGPAMPVRLRFETTWFGDATMYLDAAETDSATVARAVP